LNTALRWDHARLRGVMRIGVPTFVENIMWTLAFMFSVRVAAQLGESALATHTYVMYSVHIIILVGISLGIAVEILAGRMIGAGHFTAAYGFVRRALWRGVALTTLVAILVAFAGQPIMRFFTRDEEIIRLGMILMWIGVLVEPGRTLNIVMNDALRAAGDASFPAKACAPSMLLVLGFGSWWLGIGLGFGLVGVWLAYALDEWIRGLTNYTRWHLKGWVPAAKQSVRIARSLGTTEVTARAPAQEAARVAP
jgi:Na+-driven multidrug efflux pump